VAPGDAAADHGGTPAVRVALAYDLKPGRIDDRVRETMRDYPDLYLKRQEVGLTRGHTGNTGGVRIPVGRIHLHQAFYRYPDYKADGSPYGGRGLKVVRHHYVRGNRGAYTFGCRKCSGVKTKGDLISK
jgi:hypothetical protein